MDTNASQGLAKQDAPPAGALFEYGLDSFGKEPARYRVTAWMRIKRPSADAADFALSGALPGEYGGHVALMVAEVVRDLKASDKDAEKPRLEFCRREFATHVSGRGIAGCVAPVGKIKVTGMVAWDAQAIAEADEHAQRLADQDARDRMPAHREWSETDVGGVLV